MKIVADNKIPLLQGVLEPFAEVVYLPGSQISKNHLLDADALITRTRTKCNKELLEGTKVKFIATATIGFDHIDTHYCEQNGIFWTNAPGCNSGSVQQYILSALSHLSEKFNFCLSDKTIGIIGVGHVGKKVEDLARKIGMNILLNDPPRERNEGDKKFVSLSELISKSDIITLHVPLNKDGIDKTYHLFDKNLLAQIPKNSFLINSSRGEVVDNKELKYLLEQKKIAGAILDVWENEPDINTGLLELVDIGTPHIAGYSLDGKANGTAMSLQALSKYFKLPLDNWYPLINNKLQKPIIKIDASGLDGEDILKKIAFSTYSIITDDASLRKNSGDFESLRGNYPVRREWFNYAFNIINANDESKKYLSRFNLNIHF